MKLVNSICVYFFILILPINAVAEATVDPASNAMQDADIYMEEILATCRAEAEGMDDAETYINECVNNMKRGFTE